MSIYKDIGSEDQTSGKTNLYEEIPITGTIVANTYGTFPDEENIKNYSHGLFQSVYDYPYLSSSANHVFDLTAGRTTDSDGVDANVAKVDKNSIYNLFAKQYVGYDEDQNIVAFNASGVLNPPDTWDPVKFSDAIFMNFSRVIMKDEIKKGSFRLTLGTGSFAGPFVGTKTFSDAYVVANDPTTYRTNSPMGDYAFLQEGTQSATVPTETNHGFIFYQAGLIVLAANTQTFGTELTSGSSFTVTTAQTPSEAMLSGSIKDIVNGVRYHIDNISFNNTTELNSTVYFCRLNHSEFNYSSNPTYTSASQIVVKNNPTDPPVSYVTTVGLYSPDNQLLAVGKLSEPLKKSSLNEFTLRMRLDT